MKPLNAAETNLVAGGENLSCSEAMMLDLIYGDDIDFTNFCTQEQSTTMAFNFIDTIYSPSFIELSDNQKIVHIIKWLGDQTV